jgi:hypothetical protein
MYGIFEVVAGDGNELDGKQLVDIVNDLFLLSESRGREASVCRNKRELYFCL